MKLSDLWTFPNPVNEYAARVTAGLVVAFACLTIAVDATASGPASTALFVAVFVGFVLRVLAGPRFSPFGRLSVHVIVPLLGRERLVPGPPKRFAQAVGVVFSGAALALHGVGVDAGARGVLAALVVAASMEAFAGFCLGCVVFGELQRRGVIPASVCEACNDVRFRSSARAETEVAGIVRAPAVL